MNKKIILAYSGGLDTTVIIPWLKDHYENCDVIACCVDVGQCADYDKLREKAIRTGAKKALVIDAKEEFITDFVFPMLKANAVYEEKYLLHICRSSFDSQKVGGYRACRRCGYNLPRSDGEG